MRSRLVWSLVCGSAVCAPVVTGQGGDPGGAECGLAIGEIDMAIWDRPDLPYRFQPHFAGNYPWERRPEAYGLFTAAMRRPGQ